MGAEQAGRVLRCGVFAAATTLLAALAHAVSGTGLPDARVLVAAGLGVGVAAHPLTRRERQLPAVLGATLAGQLALHVVLTVSMLPSCTPAGGSVTRAVVPTMAGMGSTAAAAGCTPGSWLPMTAPGRPGVVMLIGHLLGAVVLAGWLRRGERGLARLAAVVARALRPIGRRLAAVCWPPPSRAPRPVSGSRTVPVPHPGLQGAGGSARRGPPGPAAA